MFTESSALQLKHLLLLNILNIVHLLITEEFLNFFSHHILQMLSFTWDINLVLFLSKNGVFHFSSISSLFLCALK